jgi:diguanylate cyclase (GGDEF)-like protein
MSLALEVNRLVNSPAMLQPIPDEPGALDEALNELGALRREHAELRQRLAEQQEALVSLNLKLNEQFVMLYSLLEFAKTISSLLDKDALLDSAIVLLDRIFDLTTVAVFEWRPKEDAFLLIGTSVPALHDVQSPSLTTTSRLVQPVLQTGQVSLVDDLPASGGEFCRRYLSEMRAALCAPMVAHGRLRGLLIAFRGEAASFSDRHFQVMSAVAGYLAIAIENCALHQQVQLQALTDELTGLLNRRAMELQLSEALICGARHRQPLSVLMIDIDHFKRFNDRYGHHLGDIVLARLGKILVNTVRRSDVCARYGGEEFLVILPGTDAGVACDIAMRIMQAVVHMPVDSIGLNAASCGYNITVSIGVATVQGACGNGAETLLNQADRAMYRAKALGRNQVCLG